MFPVALRGRSLRPFNRNIVETAEEGKHDGYVSLFSIRVSERRKKKPSRKEKTTKRKERPTERSQRKEQVNGIP